jgi:hypothetical protein
VDPCLGALVGNTHWNGRTDVVASRHFLWHQQLGKTSKRSYIYGLVFNFAHQIQSLLPHPYMLLIAKNVYVFNYGGAKAIDAKDRIFTSSPTEP